MKFLAGAAHYPDEGAMRRLAPLSRARVIAPHLEQLIGGGQRGGEK